MPVAPKRLVVLATVMGLHLASVAPAAQALSDLRGEPVTKIGTPLLSPSPAGARLAEQRPDGRGLKLCGPGEWLLEKHAAKVRRSWRKLHIGVDADTGQIIAAD